MGLKDYKRKRNFEETAEPEGKIKHSKSQALHFVVQMHQASHLHYDFRLEVNGVLKSWAVPKGPSLNPADKRLAIQVEDHPFDYRTFEGTIPEGNYGAGQVIVWDEGTYTAAGAASRKESERLMEQGLENGHVSIVLDGHKLKGEYSLIQLKSRDKQWLLVKKKDASASEIPVTNQSQSVLSKQTLKPKKEKAPSAKKSAAPLKPAPIPNEEPKPLIQSPMPNTVKPMLATLIEEPFDDKDWLFEIKWDGYRALAKIQNQKATLISRNAQTFNKRFPAIAEDLQVITMDALLDGEVVVLDEKGKPNFQLVQNYQRTQEGDLVYYVFDLLYLKGYDLRHLPLLQRKELLKKLLPESPRIRFCDHVIKKGKAFFQAALKKGFEGIIAKASQSPYQQGRSHDWLKIKTHLRQEALICGFTAPKGAREYFGALLLGVYDQGRLVYVGHTGSGFDRKKLAELYERLLPLVQDKCPFSTPPETRASATWVKPELICEVSFAEWTKGELMRQAIFLDLREDKRPKEIVKEKTVSVQEAIKDSNPSLSQTSHSEKKTSSHKQAKRELQSPSLLILTHLDKVYWPEEGYTKGDLIDYYRQAAPFILPYLKDRPETLRRYPNGIEGSSFYQKEVEHIPDWLRTESVRHEDHDVRYLFIENEDSLLYAANLGCIDLNPFNSRFQSLLYPDYLVIDLDPEDVEFDQVLETAQAVHRILNKWDIPSVCKTSGATGFHIYIPLGARYTHEEANQFAKLIAHLAHQELPDLTSLERSPSKRQKRVYLDYLQNNFGQTVVAPYSVRPKPGAPVSTPLKWTEVKPGLLPTDFTIKTVMKRFKKVGDLFKPILGKGINLQKILQRMESP